MGQAPFVGRSTEVELIGRLAAEALDGRPRVAWLEGDAGAGKSALVDAIAPVLSPFAAVRADAVDGGAEAPMWLVDQLVPALPRDPRAAAEQLHRHLTDGGHPVAVVVEDLHWADEPSQQTLALALERLAPGDRVLAIATSRIPGEVAAGWRRFADDPDRCERIRLGALGVDDVVALAMHHGIVLPPRAASSLRDHTEGHPLHLRTLLTELTPEQLTAPGPLPAPRSLAASTCARVAELPSGAVELIAALAVVGGPAPVALLGDVLGETVTDEAIAAAVSSGIVATGDGDPPSLCFSHGLHRTAIYGDLAPTRRRDLHARAARHVGDRMDALGHAVLAAEPTDDCLADELEVAAADLDDVSSSIRLLTAAADLSAVDGKAEHRVRLAIARAVASGDANALRSLEPRLDDMADTAERNHALGWLAWHRGDAAAAERWLEHAARSTPIDPATPAIASMELGGMYALQSRGVEAIAAADRALASPALDRRNQDRAWLVKVRGVGQRDGGTSALELLLQRFPDPWDLDVDPERLRVRAVQSFFAGRPTAAIAWFDSALAHPGVHQLTAALAHMHLVRGECKHSVGDWDGSLLDAHRAIELAIDLDHRWVLPQSYALAASTHAAQGRAATARDLLARVAAVDAATASYEAASITAVGHAMLAHAADDHLGVIRALEGLYADGGGRAPMASTLLSWPMYVDALIDVGRIDEAVGALDLYRQAAEARRLDVGVYVGQLEAHLAIVDGRADEALDRLESAAAAANDDTEALERIVGALRHGRLLRSVGRRADAVDVLTAGRDLAVGARGAPYVERFDRELTAIGDARPAEAPRSRFDLTARERDVADLVATGMTNKEIAAELFVSVKAVEYHLGNIYAKFGVSNRRALRATIDPA